MRSRVYLGILLLRVVIWMSFLVMHVSSASSTAFNNYLASGLQNVILADHLLLESDAASTLSCARTCSATAACTTFTFSKTSGASGKCRTHSFLRTPADANTVVSPGTTSYERQTQRVRDCQEARDLSLPGDFHRLYIDAGLSVTAFCDGNWTVFQRRKDAGVDFHRDWTDYVNGFGDITSSYWLGLEALHKMTSAKSYDLQVDLLDWEGTPPVSASYSRFTIGPASANYNLYFLQYLGGAAGNGLKNHKRQFSTRDKDNDSDQRNCAQEFRGGWWFKSCRQANLNGDYLNTSAYTGLGIIWNANAFWKSHRFAQMKIRPTPAAVASTDDDDDK